MIEFAIVVVLLITMLYGIISYGLILAAQSTITQAAADAARCRHRDLDDRSRHRRGTGRHRRRLDGQGHLRHIGDDHHLHRRCRRPAPPTPTPSA